MIWLRYSLGKDELGYILVDYEHLLRFSYFVSIVQITDIKWSSIALDILGYWYTN